MSRQGPFRKPTSKPASSAKRISKKGKARMAEERFCPHCGRANPKAMPRCMNCGQRIVKGVISGMMLLEEETAPDAINRAPWWQTDPGSAIPPPPQVREEVARVEAKTARYRTPDRRKSAAFRSAFGRMSRPARKPCRKALQQKPKKASPIAGAAAVRRAKRGRSFPFV